jgi:hypothetical protein
MSRRTKGRRQDRELARCRESGKPFAGVCGSLQLRFERNRYRPNSRAPERRKSENRGNKMFGGSRRISVRRAKALIFSV